MSWDIEPYQIEVNKVICKHCGEDSDYDFCSDGCSRAYWKELE
tara:strand:- start:1292 stop:1420 length:129 start_codon:yes stop_codon:yes gene_type:complete